MLQYYRYNTSMSTNTTMCSSSSNDDRANHSYSSNSSRPTAVVSSTSTSNRRQQQQPTLLSSSLSSSPLLFTHNNRNSRIIYIKGIVVLTLLLISESFTIVNAISFWKNIIPPLQQQQQQQQQGHCNTEYESSTSSTSKHSTTCSNSGSGHHSAHSPTVITTPPPFHWWNINRLQNKEQQLSRKTNPNESNKNFLATIVSNRGGSNVDPITTTASTILATATTPFHIPLNVWKILFQSFLTLLNVICWYVPLKLHTHQQKKAALALLEAKATASTTTNTTNVMLSDNNTKDETKSVTSAMEQNQYILSMANAFSGGVFLSLAFGHLIPECVHGFIATTTTSSTSTISSLPEEVPYLFVLFGYLLIFFVEKVAFSDSHELLHHHDHHHDDHPEPHPAAIIAASASTTSSIDHQQISPLHQNGMNGSTTGTNEGNNKNNVAVTGRSALVLLGALAVHSVLEMMALGLADTFRDCALLTISISLHQPAESIALLVAFIKSGLSESQIILFLSFFSSMGMMGVILGMIVNEYAAPIIDSIMLAVVAGTFVYVGATEIIPEEFESTQYKWNKFVALLSGIVTILCITQYTSTFGGGH